MHAFTVQSVPKLNYAAVRARKCVGVCVAESMDWKGKRREVASSQMWGKICGV
jgi:hypothetical protein